MYKTQKIYIYISSIPKPRLFYLTATSRVKFRFHQCYEGQFPYLIGKWDFMLKLKINENENNVESHLLNKVETNK